MWRIILSTLIRLKQKKNNRKFHIIKYSYHSSYENAHLNSIKCANIKNTGRASFVTLPVPLRRSKSPLSRGGASYQILIGTVPVFGADRDPVCLVAGWIRITVLLHSFQHSQIRFCGIKCSIQIDSIRSAGP